MQSDIAKKNLNGDWFYEIISKPKTTLISIQNKKYPKWPYLLIIVLLLSAFESVGINHLRMTEYLNRIVNINIPT